MMREEVAIILNEREQTKIRAAETLVERLAGQSLRAARLPINENIVRSVRTRKPRVVVLDYLLGDLTTGLDILTELMSLPLPHRPSCFFLTDEPSQSVAIEAMRLGCRDFFHIESQQAIERLCIAIQDEISQSANPEVPIAQAEPYPDLDSLVASSRQSVALVNHAKRCAKMGPPLILISGPTGSGKSTLARAIYREWGATSYLREVDAQGTTVPLRSILNSDPEDKILGVVGLNVSLLLLHAEEDNGEFIIEYAQRMNGTPQKRSGNSVLNFITTQDPQLAAVWRKKVPDLEHLAIAPLNERRDDIPVLVHRFHHEASHLLNQKIKPFSSSVLSWCTDRHWPGDIRQLRAVIMHLALQKETEDRELGEQLALQWEHERSSATLLYSRQTAATALLHARGDYRIAAARLGLNTAALSTLLSQKESA